MNSHELHHLRSQAPMCPAAPQTVTVTGSIALIGASMRRRAPAAPAKQGEASRLAEAPMVGNRWEISGKSDGNPMEIAFIAGKKMGTWNSSEILGVFEGNIPSFGGLRVLELT